MLTNPILQLTAETWFAPSSRSLEVLISFGMTIGTDTLSHQRSSQQKLGVSLPSGSWTGIRNYCGVKNSVRNSWLSCTVPRVVLYSRLLESTNHPEGGFAFVRSIPMDSKGWRDNAITTLPWSNALIRARSRCPMIAAKPRRPPVAGPV